MKNTHFSIFAAILMSAAAPSLLSVPAQAQSQLDGRRILPATLPVSKINATGTPSSATYLRGDATWAVPTPVSDHTVGLSTSDASPDFLDAKLGVSGILTIADASGVRVIGMGAAAAGVSGYLLGSDWNTFNAKEPALGSPTASGYVLSSTAAGVRSWIMPQSGPAGAQGPAGASGTNGTNGAAGTAATVAVGATTTLAAGSAATVTNSGTSAAAVLNFGIPQGTAGAAGTGGSGGGTSNYFGSGADGAATISASTTWDNSAAANDTGLIVKNFTSLTINSGAVVTAAHRSQVMLVYVSGNCTIAGSLNMDAMGAAQAPASDMVIRKYLTTASQYFATETSGQTFVPLTLAATIPAVGAAGAVGTTSSGVAGTSGANGQTGGGGSGGSSGGTSTSGNGAAGTSFCGGSGGGAGGYGGSSPTGKPAASSGGAGGAGGTAVANTAAYVFAGGAGNPPGVGTASSGATAVAASGGGGGTIILVVKGSLTISGSLSAAGAAGGTGTGSNYSGGVWGGGGAGGGSILLLYGGTYSHAGTVSAAGGAGGLGGSAAGPTSVSSSACSGGAGGTGSVLTYQIQNS